MLSNTEVSQITVTDNEVTGVITKDGHEIITPYIIIAPGRDGCGWLMDESSRLGLTKYTNSVDLGLRVEVPQPVLHELTEAL